MSTAIKIPEGATREYRDKLLKEWADKRTKEMFKRSPSFHKSILRLWSRNRVKVKNGFRVD